MSDDDRSPAEGVGFMRDGVFHGGTPASYGEWASRQGRIPDGMTVTPEGNLVAKPNPEEAKRSSIASLAAKLMARSGLERE